MNNYSFFQQQLHKFALSYQFIREASFDINRSIYGKSTKFKDHIFVCGLARSGTTTVLNALYKSGIFASLSYADMPFVMAPNIWSSLFIKKNEELFIERAHGDGIKVSTSSPEAFEEVFWLTFSENKNSKVYFEEYINNIINNRNKERYLSKNNQNIKRLEFLAKSFPESKIIVPFREPLQHTFSLLTQHQKFIDAGKKDAFISLYMKLIGHTEFGPNYIPIHNTKLKYPNTHSLDHWLEQWHEVYKNLLVISKYRNIRLLCYEKLCNVENAWTNLRSLAKIKNEYSFDFKESLKRIENDHDNELLSKCRILYEKLENLSI